MPIGTSDPPHEAAAPGDQRVMLDFILRTLQHNARPSFEAAAQTHFGRRAPTVDYVRRG
jgi:hypothetical protein